MSQPSRFRVDAACGHGPHGCGCRHAACCFECPLEACVFDSKAVKRKTEPRLVEADMKRELVLGALGRGVSVTDVVATLGISESRVYQIRRGA